MFLLWFLLWFLLVLAPFIYSIHLVQSKETEFRRAHADNRNWNFQHSLVKSLNWSVAVVENNVFAHSYTNGWAHSNCNLQIMRRIIIQFRSWVACFIFFSFSPFGRSVGRWWWCCCCFILSFAMMWSLTLECFFARTWSMCTSVYVLSRVGKSLFRFHCVLFKRNFLKCY